MIYIRKSVGDKDMDYNIANKIKEIRRSKNITQEKLSEECGFSRSKISSWENNKREMSITDAIEFAHFFNISLDIFLDNEPISEDVYMEISQKFFFDTKISLEEKINIIKIFERGIVENNIWEIYEKYKMSLSETNLQK